VPLDDPGDARSERLDAEVRAAAHPLVQQPCDATSAGPYLWHEFV
jgi:hypothetical protein